MVNLFKAKTHIQDDDPHNKLTRFKRMHVRDAPVNTRDDGIDPNDRLTRTAHTHVRPTIAPNPRPAAGANILKRIRHNTMADLHASDPISTDVLRRALPLRSAMIDG